MMNGSPTPVFLFGMERSGTTLLSMMMGAHPHLAVPLSTTGLWYSFYKRLNAGYDGMRTAPDTERLVDDIMAHERIKLWGTPLSREHILAEAIPSRYDTVVYAFHQEYARQKNKRYWGNIDIATLDSMHVAHSLFNNAKFVHIVRDGRDVALSHQSVPFGAGNIAECAEAWITRVRQNLRMGALLGADQYLMIKYEDLVSAPEETLEIICDFIGVEYSPEMLQYHEAVDNNIPDEKQWMWPKLKKPPQKTNINKWKHGMTYNQRIVFENIAAPLLSELDYETFERTPKAIGAYLLETGYFLDRGGRKRRWLGRMGIRRAIRPNE